MTQEKKITFEYIVGQGDNSGDQHSRLFHFGIFIYVDFGRVYNFALTHSHTMTPSDAPGKQAFGKHCGKRRNCS